MSTRLGQQQCALLNVLADVLTPAAEGMPAASAVGIADVLLDQVLNYRPDLREPLMRILRAADGQDPESFIRGLADQDPVTFRSFGLIVAGGYYLSPQVRALIGYPGQERRPFDPDAIPDHESEALLDRVRKRGAFWRKTD